MRTPRAALGAAGIATVLGLCLASAAAASEVLDLLADLDSELRTGQANIVACQERLDQLQLGGELQGQQPTLTKMASDLDELADKAARAMDDLRGKMAKLAGMHASLVQRFPEDAPRIDLYYTDFQGKLRRSEVLYQSIRQDLASARQGLETNLGKQTDPSIREELLSRLKERHREREQTIAERNRAGASEEQALENPPRAGLGLESELGHPPVRPPAERRESAKAGNVTVDLEQLIREMEN